MTREQPTRNDVLQLLALARQVEDEELLAIMLDDLIWSAEQIDPGVRARAIIHSLGIKASKDHTGYDEETRMRILTVLDEWSVLGQRHVDFAIVTVKEPEFDAAKLAFGITAGQEPDGYRRGAYFYDVELARTDRKSLSGVITKCGMAGNSTMAAFLSTLFAVYDVGLCCLVGMAAGPRSQVKLGDVVFAEKVVDAGRRIATPSEEQPDRVEYYPDTDIVRDFSNFHPERSAWHDLLAELIAATQEEGWQVPLPKKLDFDFAPALRRKAILASDELIEDDSLEHRAALFGPRRRTGAIEMEAAGFATACRENRVPWLVIRGIADYGRVRQGRRQTDWQFVSTLAAGTAIRIWLQSCRFYG